MTSGGNHLPKSWATPKLRELVQPTRPRESPQKFPDLPFIGMENIEAHTMKLVSTVPASTMRSNAVHFYPGDVLYGRLRPYLNKVYRPEFEGLCSAEFITFPENDWLNSKYLQFFLNSSVFVSFASHLNAGDRPRVDFDQIGEYSVSLAPLQEQKRIVSEIEKQFTRLDVAVAALKRVQANLKRYRAAVLKAACEGRLVPTEAELARREGRSYEPASDLLKRILAERRNCWEAAQLSKFRASGKLPKDDSWKQRYKLPEQPNQSVLSHLPEGWSVATLDQLTSKIVDGTHFTPTYVPEGIPFLSVKDIHDDSISFDDCKYITREEHDALSKRCDPQKGDLLVTKSGTIGRAAVICIDRTFSLFVSVALLKPASPEISMRWLSLAIQNWIKTIDIQQEIKGSAMKNLHIEDFRLIVSTLPPQPEQFRIISEIERHFSLIKQMEQAIEANLKRSENLRKAILKRAFEGKLVPQDLDDEPASVLLERIRAERHEKSSSETKIQKRGPTRRAKVRVLAEEKVHE